MNNASMILAQTRARNIYNSEKTNNASMILAHQPIKSTLNG